MKGRDQLKRGIQETDEVVQLISFAIGSERFGVEILVIQEIIMMSAITEIPNSPEFVEGVINLRGNIIPVLDLRKRLRLRGVPRAEGFKPGTRILVVEIDENVRSRLIHQSATRVSFAPRPRCSRIQ